MQVDECRPFGDESKPRAWSKYAKDSSAYKRANPEADVKWSSSGGGGEGGRAKNDTNTIKKVIGDVKFGEFLEVQKNPVDFALKNDDEDVGDTSHVMSEDEIMSRLLDGVTGKYYFSVKKSIKLMERFELISWLLLFLMSNYRS